MKKKFLSAVTVATLILVIPSFLLSCDKKSITISTNSEISDHSGVLSKISSVDKIMSSSIDSSKSIFDIMKEERIDVVSTNDSNTERAKLLQEFLDEACVKWNTFYKENFIKSIDNKEIYNVEYCNIDKGNDDIYYGWGRMKEGTDSLMNVLLFNAIQSTKQEDEYIIFDTKKPNQNIFEYESSSEEISGVHIVVKNNKIVKFRTPIGDFDFWDTSMNDYINQKQLVGNYQDQDGKNYQFTGEEDAIWPDRTFEYLLFDINNYDSWEFWLDCNAICVIDPVTKKTTGTYYGYKFVKDELYIYNMIEGQPWGYYPEENPILILHKVENIKNAEIVEETKYYKIICSNSMFYYYFFNENSDLVKSGGPLNDQPHISMVNDNLIRFVLQAGTGIGTQWGFYYDTRTNVFSQIFQNIYDQSNDKVAFGNVNKVIIQDIFNKTHYYHEISSFKEPFSEVAEPVRSVEFINSGHSIKVSYLTGSDYRIITDIIRLD